MKFKICLQNPKRTRTFIYYEDIDMKKMDAIELLTKNSLKKIDRLFPIKGQTNRFTDNDIILTIEQIL
ncbi:MAG: hypothetical protein K8R79_02015 [Calditrichales bacterium]|nr:hypothetical protein [Calditrichales bacterium]